MCPFLSELFPRRTRTISSNDRRSMYQRIEPERLKKWLGGLRDRVEVLAPGKENGLWTFRRFDGLALPRGFQNSRLPPKALFLEPLKALFEWKSQGDSFKLNPFPPADGQRVIFGIRACDARALRILQPVFVRDYEDAFYLRNLSRTLLLGEACQVQCQGSFCEEMGIDPQDSGDCDLFFREIPQGYMVKVLSERGAALMGEGDLFEKASEEEWSSARRKIRGSRKKPFFDLERVRARASERFSEESLWQRISATCINCGICTYLCPTCHCFDLCDLQTPGGAVRFRRWDSCAFPAFTKMAGHNPREEKWRRYRQRVSHKFNFFYQNFQAMACVGCGRCVAYCPVNLDLREVLLEVAG